VPATTVRPRRVLLLPSTTTLALISRPVCCDRPRKESQQSSCTYLLSELPAPSNCQVPCPHLARPPGFPRAPTFPPPLIAPTEPTRTTLLYTAFLWTRREKNTIQYREVRSTVNRQQHPPQSLHLPATQSTTSSTTSPTVLSQLGTPRSAPRLETNRPSFFVLPLRLLDHSHS
jgi:hypothetical protein